MRPITSRRLPKQGRILALELAQEVRQTASDRVALNFRIHVAQLATEPFLNSA